MKKNKKLSEDLNTLENMLNVVQTYQEIAAMRMRRVKQSVLSSREFMDDLNNTFRRVTYAYELYLKNVKKSKESGEIIHKNGKDVLVFLSSNMGLYGDIVRKTFKLFLSDVEKISSNTDLVIVGKVGRDMFLNANTNKNFTYFDLSDSGTDPANLSKILNLVLDYSHITVYHGIFKSVLSQEATKSVVTGEAAELEREYEAMGEMTYLFEPSVERIADYFANEILSSVFEQETFEANLSKFSSRMVSLYSASDNIQDSLKKVDFSLKKYNHKVLNSKQIAILSGINLWSKA
ncbi:hypothetical protein A3K42_00970 [candidate division WWE3 bacterium RBG_13_37_7]|uniref:ATP synthase gamma chain n=1 Tax=candidate division WWE3 bacterium RBG_13_37_7 TaxID=1802609 RepID=A0A1F4U094_UNCKA|nr:MAG: hypothetical protein A3K42_00970 [candidate division WWE3 bacterium RBG_13_37_7]